MRKSGIKPRKNRAKSTSSVKNTAQPMRSVKAKNKRFHRYRRKNSRKFRVGGPSPLQRLAWLKVPEEHKKHIPESVTYDIKNKSAKDMGKAYKNARALNPKYNTREPVWARRSWIDMSADDKPKNVCDDPVYQGKNTQGKTIRTTNLDEIVGEWKILMTKNQAIRCLLIDENVNKQGSWPTRGLTLRGVYNLIRGRELPHEEYHHEENDDDLPDIDRKTKLAIISSLPDETIDQLMNTDIEISTDRGQESQDEYEKILKKLSRTKLIDMYSRSHAENLRDEHI